MRCRGLQVLILLAVGLSGLASCSTSSKLGDTAATTDSVASPDTTGTIVTPPAEPGPSGEPIAPLSTPGLAGDDPNDDVALGKKYFRANSFGLAEKSFRSAVEKRPRDAEAWVGLAATYDRLRRFDLADRAYGEAQRLTGPTVEVLNDEGFSYMLRGDYARADHMLRQALAKDPSNPYVQANLQLLQDSVRQRKAVQ
ncbi:MAG TPA: tetratricopeptide repeat protein [Xanthobacteraceae bacterium]|jgi:tetratricopeptide (TPR) repeat protein|nr:tetratricopeptide repeat protein [Xanthobacteraceae bacterium]